MFVLSLLCTHTHADQIHIDDDEQRQVQNTLFHSILLFVKLQNSNKSAASAYEDDEREKKHFARFTLLFLLFHEVNKLNGME